MTVISNKVYMSFHANVILLSINGSNTIIITETKVYPSLKNNYSIRCKDVSSNKNH